MREILISCPDATGLGVDICRVILDFGLTIQSADLSTDAQWCFLVMRVALAPNAPPRWNLLKERLEAYCPNSTDYTLQRLQPWLTESPKIPFLLKISGYDQQGMLNALTQALWDLDVSAIKASISTNENGVVEDLFWLTDNKNELPDPGRKAEICDRVIRILGKRAHCGIEQADVKALAMPSSLVDAGAHSINKIELQRSCSTSTSFSNLRRLTKKNDVREEQHMDVLCAAHAVDIVSTTLPLQESSLPADATQNVEVVVDNATSASFTMLTLRCADRKGLLYDIFRALKNVDVRIGYGRLSTSKVKETDVNVVEADLFVQDVQTGRVLEPHMLDVLCARVKRAVALPLKVDVVDRDSGRSAELTVAAEVDAGGRGRPRVTHDVTRGLSAVGVSVDVADVFVNGSTLSVLKEEGGSDMVESPPALEVHRFLVHRIDGKPTLASEEDKKVLQKVIEDHLLGTSAAALTTPHLLSHFEGPSMVSERKSKGADLLKTLSAQWSSGLV